MKYLCLLKEQTNFETEPFAKDYQLDLNTELFKTKNDRKTLLQVFFPLQTIAKTRTNDIDSIDLAAE